MKKKAEKTGSIKERVKAKAKAVKDRLKGTSKKASAIAVAFALGALVTGCMTPEQASRSTSGTVGDVEPTVKIELGGGCSSNSVSVVIHNTFGDGAIASADSDGSTESQTQTPTFDISPKTDLRYNDALSAASVTSKGILETLADTGVKKVLAMMESGGSGTVTVNKLDGTQAVVTCENGQCVASQSCSGGSCAK